MINWRSITEDGLPTDRNIGYLVTDGESIEYSDIEIDFYLACNPKTRKNEYTAKVRSINWVGGSVYAVYEEVSGTEFDFNPTHWCPVTELNLPLK